jgi:hypothetical protein
MTVYTLGIWTVKPGREEDFVRAWQELADRTKSDFPDERATLLRDRDHLSQFHQLRTVGVSRTDRAVACVRYFQTRCRQAPRTARRVRPSHHGPRGSDSLAFVRLTDSDLSAVYDCHPRSSPDQGRSGGADARGSASCPRPLGAPGGPAAGAGPAPHGVSGSPGRRAHHRAAKAAHWTRWSTSTLTVAPGFDTRALTCPLCPRVNRTPAHGLGNRCFSDLRGARRNFDWRSTSVPRGGASDWMGPSGCHPPPVHELDDAPALGGRHRRLGTHVRTEGRRLLRPQPGRRTLRNDENRWSLVSDRTGTSMAILARHRWSGTCTLTLS